MIYLSIFLEAIAVIMYYALTGYWVLVIIFGVFIISAIGCATGAIKPEDCK